MSAFIRIPENQLDAEGENVVLHGSDNQAVIVSLSASALEQLERRTATQPLYSYISGQPNAELPVVSTGELRLTIHEVQGILAQARAATSYNNVIWDSEPGADPLLHRWLQPYSRSLVCRCAGLSAELEVSALRVVRRSAVRAIAAVDQIFVRRSIDQASTSLRKMMQHPPSITSALHWFQWLQGLDPDIVAQDRKAKMRAIATTSVEVTLKAYSDVFGIESGSYASRFMLQKRDAQMAIALHLSRDLEKTYAYLRRKAKEAQRLQRA